MNSEKVAVPDSEPELSTPLADPARGGTPPARRDTWRWIGIEGPRCNVDAGLCTSLETRKATLYPAKGAEAMVRDPPTDPESAVRG